MALIVAFSDLFSLNVAAIIYHVYFGYVLKFEAERGNLMCSCNSVCLILGEIPEDHREKRLSSTAVGSLYHTEWRLSIENAIAPAVCSRRERCLSVIFVESLNIPGNVNCQYADVSVFVLQTVLKYAFLKL